MKNGSGAGATDCPHGRRETVGPGAPSSDSSEVMLVAGGREQMPVQKRGMACDDGR